MTGMDAETISKSHIWLFDYYQELSCWKQFNRYNKCIQKHGEPSKCEDENKKSGDCISGFWNSVNTTCRPLIDKESIDESGYFKKEFVKKFDNCLDGISKKDVSSDSLMMAPHPGNGTNLESSLPILGMLFSRRACASAFTSYKLCRKNSDDVHSCSELGKELVMCNMKFAQAVIPNCVNAVSSFYQARQAQDKTASPPSNREVLGEYFKCLVSAEGSSSTSY